MPAIKLTAGTRLNLTVTLIFTVFFPDLTVIVTFPFFLAVITPLELTVATLLLELLKVIFSIEVYGRRTGFNVIFCFIFRVVFLPIPVILVVFTLLFCTFTIIFFSIPLLSLTVTVAFPVSSALLISHYQIL